jgi:predicted phage terminase large subunit-like protein
MSKCEIFYTTEPMPLTAGAAGTAVLRCVKHNCTWIIDANTCVIGRIEALEGGQWSALERERRLLQTAQSDSNFCHPYSVYIEQEPGSGGKESAEASVRMLKGFRAYADKVTGSKEVRAEPFAAQVQGGNVKLCAGSWQYSLLDEMESFPNGKYRDQVDACSGAFTLGRLQTRYSDHYRLQPLRRASSRSGRFHCSIGITLGDRNQRNPPIHRTVGCRRSRSSSGSTSWRRKASSVSVSLSTIAAYPTAHLET